MLSKTRCPIGSKKAIFNLLIKGGPAPQKCYARVWPGHRVLGKPSFNHIGCRVIGTVLEAWGAGVNAPPPRPLFEVP